MYTVEKHIIEQVDAYFEEIDNAVEKTRVRNSLFPDIKIPAGPLAPLCYDMPHRPHDLNGHPCDPTVGQRKFCDRSNYFKCAMCSNLVTVAQMPFRERCFYCQMPICFNCSEITNADGVIQHWKTNCIFFTCTSHVRRMMSREELYCHISAVKSLGDIIILIERLLGYKYTDFDLDYCWKRHGEEPYKIWEDHYKTYLHHMFVSFAGNAYLHEEIKMIDLRNPFEDVKPDVYRASIIGRTYEELAANIRFMRANINVKIACFTNLMMEHHFTDASKWERKTFPAIADCEAISRKLQLGGEVTIGCSYYGYMPSEYMLHLHGIPGCKLVPANYIFSIKGDRLNIEEEILDKEEPKPIVPVVSEWPAYGSLTVPPYIANQLSVEKRKREPSKDPLDDLELHYEAVMLGTESKRSRIAVLNE